MTKSNTYLIIIVLYSIVFQLFDDYISESIQSQTLIFCEYYQLLH